jgi:hypothetical protein
MKTGFQAVVLAFGLLVAAASISQAQEAKPEVAPAPAAETTVTPTPAPEAKADPAATAAPPGGGDVKVTDSPPEIELTADEKAERDSRKACKVDICAAFRKPSAGGADISCDVVKSWRKEQLGKLVGRLKVSWPYGPVRCTSAVKLKRADLHKAMTDEKFETQLDKHEVSCVVDRLTEPAADIKFDFSPKVTFEKGLAVKAKINWGKLEAPTLIKGALWTATAADNTVNILSTSLVEDINSFIGKKCDEVKEEWAAK